MKNYLILITVLLFTNISFAAAFSPGDIEWNPPANGTLYGGDKFINGEYSVVAKQFSSPVPGMKNLQGNIVPDAEVIPLVHLEIYKGETLIKEIVMEKTGEPYIDPEYEFSVSANDFLRRSAKEWVYEYYNPWVTISTRTRGTPAINVEVLTDKDIYTSHTDKIIKVWVRVINSGEAVARNVDVDLSIGDLKLTGSDIKLHQNFIRIEKKSIVSYLVTLSVPELITRKDYKLTASAKGYDVKDIEYRSEGSTLIKFVAIEPEVPYLTVNKGLKDRIYLNDNETVRLSIVNSNRYDVRDISILDSMNENFELETNRSLEWNVPLLRPGEEWKTEYTMRPMRANLNGFLIPEAVTRFKVNNNTWSASSKTWNLIVNGPIIILNKTVDKNAVAVGDKAMVTVSVSNEGNIPTRVYVKDSLPDAVSLVSGTTNLDTTFLGAGKTQGFSYYIQGDSEGEVELSPAVATYLDIEYRGTRWLNTSSDTPTVSFMSPEDLKRFLAEQDKSASRNESSEIKKQKTESPEATPYTPGFTIVFAVVILTITALHRRRKKVLLFEKYK